VAKGVKVSIKDIDRGFKKFQKSAKFVAKEKPFVKAGILESAGKHEDSDLSVAAVATFQEFGTERIPERSFFRAMQEQQRQNIRDFILSLKDGVIIRADQALGLLGIFLVDLLKKQVDKTNSHPLSPRTISEKGSTKPLIDTGQMRNSIQYEVKKGGST